MFMTQGRQQKFFEGGFWFFFLEKFWKSVLLWACSREHALEHALVSMSHVNVACDMLSRACSWRYRIELSICMERARKKTLLTMKNLAHKTLLRAWSLYVRESLPLLTFLRQNHKRHQTIEVNKKYQKLDHFKNLNRAYMKAEKIS